MAHDPPTDARGPEQAQPAPLAGVLRQEGATIDEVAPPIVPLGFWQQPAVQSVLPFITSLVLHACILIVLIMGYQAAVQLVPQVREQIIIPDASIIEGEGTGGLPHPGLGSDPNRDAAQDNIETPGTDGGWANRPSQTVTNALQGSGAGDDETDGRPIGVGQGRGFGRGNIVGGGTGDGSGELAQFGPPGGGSGIAPKSPFMGIGGNAMRVVYLCDASGTMITDFDFLKVELRRAVGVLRPVQAFNIIFFRDDVATAINETSLVFATDENKQLALEFINQTKPYGQTKPFAAIEMAFAHKPQLIYVLTDGFDNVDSYDRVVQAFRDLNKDKTVKVNTILIQARKDAELENVLRTIATENGGTFKMVAQDEWSR